MEHEQAEKCINSIRYESREMLKKMSRLKVYDVGDSVSTFKAGDEVLVDPGQLKDALLIPLTDDKEVLLLSPFDIIHVW